MAEYSIDEIKENFKEFFEESGYTPDLIRTADNFPDQRSITIEYNEMLLGMDHEFARFVLDNPTLSLNQAQEAIGDIVGSSYKDVTINVRIEKLPDARNIRIRDLRAEDLTKFISVDGLVRKASEVRPRINVAVFRCERCRSKIRKKQDTNKVEEPVKCPECDKPAQKTNFTLLLEDSEFMDYQTLEVQESPEGLRGGEQPQRINGWVKEDLVGDVSPGDRITLNGILHGEPKNKSARSKSRTFNIHMIVNSIEIKEYEYEDVELSDEDKEKILKAAEDERVFSNILDSIAPSIRELRAEKMGLALQMFGGARKTTPDGNKIRGDIHILLVGDPGTAKSQLLRYITDLAPRSMYASGKGTTGAGLTAAAVREDVLGESQWTLEAGTLVLADKGIAAVDELDKMRAEDRSAMHEAMEQQTISVAKAGINATLNSRCAVLGAANPQYGRFARHENISQQINLPPPLISRFDLIFAIMDTPDKERDRGIAEHILNLNKEGERMMLDEHYEPKEEFSSRYEKEFMRKYIAYAKSITPEMSEESIEKLKKFYLDLRKKGGEEDAIPITARQLESLVRLSEASARAHLRGKVLIEDAERAINVTRHFLNQVASNEGGDLDIDLVSADVSHSERTLLHEIRVILQELEEIHPDGVPKDEIIKEAADHEISREDALKEIDRMRQNGVIFKPQEGKYKFV